MLQEVGLPPRRLPSGSLGCGMTGRRKETAISRPTRMRMRTRRKNTRKKKRKKETTRKIILLLPRRVQQQPNPSRIQHPYPPRTERKQLDVVRTASSNHPPPPPKLPPPLPPLPSPPPNQSKDPLNSQLPPHPARQLPPPAVNQDQPLLLLRLLLRR